MMVKFLVLFCREHLNSSHQPLNKIGMTSVSARLGDPHAGMEGSFLSITCRIVLPTSPPMPAPPPDPKESGDSLATAQIGDFYH